MTSCAVPTPTSARARFTTPNAARARRPGFVSPSFSTIAGWNANGALPHYRATEESHSVIEGEAPVELAGDARVTFTIERLNLVDGTYKLDVAVHRQNGAPYDYQKKALSLTVTARTGGVGVYFPEHCWEFEGGVRWQPAPRAPGIGSRRRPWGAWPLRVWPR